MVDANITEKLKEFDRLLGIKIAEAQLERGVKTSFSYLALFGYNEQAIRRCGERIGMYSAVREKLYEAVPELRPAPKKPYGKMPETESKSQ